jgi:hypothetical protein
VPGWTTSGGIVAETGENEEDPMADEEHSIARKSRLDRFFTLSPTDRRAALPEVVDRVSWWLGAEWTPSEEQIEAARRRRQLVRSDPAHAARRWRRLEGDRELEEARQCIAYATDAAHTSREGTLSAWGVARAGRVARGLLLEPDVAIYRRDLICAPGRFLLELQHPQLDTETSAGPVGLRFVGLARDRWASADGLGAWIDGQVRTFVRAVSPDLDAHPLVLPDGAPDEERIEEYAELAVDQFRKDSPHVILLIGDRQDVLVDPPDGFARQVDPIAALGAKVRLPPSGVPPAAPWEACLGLRQGAVVPPTVLRGVPRAADKQEHALVMSTCVVDWNLLHVVWQVFADGKLGEAVVEQRLTPDHESVPMRALRDIADQRAALAKLAPPASAARKAAP